MRTYTEECSAADWERAYKIGLRDIRRITVDINDDVVSVLAGPDEDSWYIVSATRVWDDAPVELTSKDERMIRHKLDDLREREDDCDPYGRDF